jgi:hypothetical protein
MSKDFITLNSQIEHPMDIYLDFLKMTPGLQDRNTILSANSAPFSFLSFSSISSRKGKKREVSKILSVQEKRRGINILHFNCSGRKDTMISLFNKQRLSFYKAKSGHISMSDMEYFRNPTESKGHDHEEIFIICSFLFA